MTSDEIRSFLDRFVRAWENQDVGALGACYAESCKVVSPIFHTLKGRAQVERSYADLFRAFASPSIRVDDIVISTDDPPRAVIVWMTWASCSRSSRVSSSHAATRVLAL